MRGWRECERDPRTNLTVGRLSLQNISTGAPFGRAHRKREGGRGRRWRVKERGSTEERGENRGLGRG